MLLSWCEWHMQVLSNIMKTWTWACYEAFVTVVERKGCHGNDNENGATATFRWSDNSLRYRCKRASVRMCETCKRWWGDPDYRVSHMSVAWKQGTRKRQLGHGASTSISYNTHAFVHGRRLGVIPLKRAFRNGSSSVRCRGSSRSRVVVGSSCTRFVDELGVTVR